MKDAFRRSEEFLDLEKGVIEEEKQKENPTAKLQNLTTDEIELLQKLLEKIGNEKSSTNKII